MNKSLKLFLSGLVISGLLSFCVAENQVQLSKEELFDEESLIKKSMIQDAAEVCADRIDEVVRDYFKYANREIFEKEIGLIDEYGDFKKLDAEMSARILEWVDTNYFSIKMKTKIGELASFLDGFGIDYRKKTSDVEEWNRLNNVNDTSKVEVVDCILAWEFKEYNKDVKWTDKIDLLKQLVDYLNVTKDIDAELDSNINESDIKYVRDILEKYMDSEKVKIGKELLETKKQNAGF